MHWAMDGPFFFAGYFPLDIDLTTSYLRTSEYGRVCSTVSESNSGKIEKWVMQQELTKDKAKLLYLSSYSKQGKSGNSMTEQEQKAALQEAEWQRCLENIAETKDRAAFQRLYMDFAPRIKHFYMQSNSPHHAEEMVNEVFIKVWQKAATYNPQAAKVSTWLFTIARNVRIDKLRRKKIKTMQCEDNDIQPRLDASQLEQERDEMMDGLSNERNASVIRRLMPKLNDEQRQVIQKVYFEDKSHQMAADELEMSLGTVKSRVRSALKLLRSNFAQYHHEGNDNE